jgi:hypothetical protein
MAQSQMYAVDQNRRPDYEWYKPENLDSLAPEESDHVRHGGLLLQKLDAVRRERYGFRTRHG